MYKRVSIVIEYEDYTIKVVKYPNWDTPFIDIIENTPCITCKEYMENKDACLKCPYSKYTREQFDDMITSFSTPLSQMIAEVCENV